MNGGFLYTYSIQFISTKSLKFTTEKKKNKREKLLLIRKCYVTRNLLLELQVYIGTDHIPRTSQILVVQVVFYKAGSQGEARRGPLL